MTNLVRRHVLGLEEYPHAEPKVIGASPTLNATAASPRCAAEAVKASQQGVSRGSSGVSVVASGMILSTPVPDCFDDRAFACEKCPLLLLSHHVPCRGHMLSSIKAFAFEGHEDFFHFKY